MKKFVKICAVTGLVLLILGIGITTVSSAMGGGYSNSLPSRIWSRVWHNHMLSTGRQSGSWGGRWGEKWDEKWDEKWSGKWDEKRDHVWDDTDDGNYTFDSSQMTVMTNPSFDQAEKLDVDIDKGVIRISQQEGISQIQVNVRDKFDRTQCYMDEYTLKIKRESGRGRNEDAPFIEVLVPTGHQFDKLSLDMGAAECTVTGITASKLDIDTGVGAITFTGTVNGDVEIETGVGDVSLNLTGPQSGYNYRVECGVGSIDVGDDHYSMLSHETHINNNAPYTMELECGVGSISVSFGQTL